MTKSAKERAIEIFAEHIELAKTDGRLFRKTVREQLMTETGCSDAAASTHYNTAKKQSETIEGLGRATVAKMPRKSNKEEDDLLLEEDECFTVLELLHHDTDVTVGRCRSYLLQGAASEDFDNRTQYNPVNVWVMIKGIGPIHGDVYKLGPNEEEIKRYTPNKIVIVTKEAPILIEEDENA